MSRPYVLSFEKPLHELEQKIKELEAAGDHAEECRRLRRELDALRVKVFKNLTAWQTVELARHPRVRARWRDRVSGAAR